MKDIIEWLRLKVRPGTRFSWLFLHQLALHASRIGDLHAEKWHHFSTHSIFDAIAEVEGLSTVQNTKRETPYRGGILKGLWHKHFFQAAFLPRNLQNINEREWDSIWDYFEQIRTKAGLQNETSIEKLAGLLAYASVFGAASHLNKPRRVGNRTNSKVSGEWIVFRKLADGLNVYLTLATHSESDQVIYARAIEAEKKVISFPPDIAPSLSKL